MNNVIATIIKFAVTGATTAASAIGGVQKAAGVATHSIATLASSLGSIGGPIGSAASQVANFIFSVKQMGAVGGIIAGFQLAFTTVSNIFIERANRMKEAVDNLASSVQRRFNSIKADALKEINDQLAKATTKADEAASRFDALASAYMKVANAQDAVAKSGGSAKMSALALEKAQAMSGEKDKDEKAILGASYDVQMAEESLRNTRDEQDRNVNNAVRESKDAAARRNAAFKREEEAQVAVKSASQKLERFRNAGADKPAIDELEAKKKEAEKSLESATNGRIKAVADATAAEHKVTEAENNRVTAINGSILSLHNAQQTEKELIESQREARRAQIERAKAELAAAKAAAKAAEDESRQRAKQENASLLSGVKDSAKAQFQQSFDLWRDPEAAAAAVEEDKKRGEDMKRFRKEVNRYGGKGKIDEYAALMRAGDEEGMQAKLQEWRKSSRFTPQTEQLVKAAAADQNKNAAERSLEKIEQNTSKLAEKIDQLLQVK